MCVVLFGKSCTLFLEVVIRALKISSVATVSSLEMAKPKRETAQRAFRAMPEWIESIEEPFKLEELVSIPSLVDENINQWIVSIKGPPKSMYEGGTFDIRFQFPRNYPSLPPKVSCLTMIYHINISSNGHICLPFFDNKGWQSDKHTVRDIILGFIDLLTEHDMSSVINFHAHDVFQESEELFGKVVKLWISKYASKENKKFEEILGKKGKDNNEIDKNVKGLVNQHVDTNPIFKIDKAIMDQLNGNNENNGGKDEEDVKDDSKQDK